MIKHTGYADTSLVQTKFPKKDVLYNAKAIIECYQEIPCNPCETSCKFNAITIGKDINQIPQIDFTKCTGCGVCVYSCPGQAISIAKIVENKAILKIPYEMFPHPLKSEVWQGVNRQGNYVTDVTIEQVLKNKRTDKTALVAISFPKEYIYDIISIRRVQ